MKKDQIPMPAWDQKYEPDWAYITTITDYSYFKGIKVLIKSLRKVKTRFPLYVMIPASMDETLKRAVEQLGVETIVCDNIANLSDAEETNKVKHWNRTFFKLNMMRLTGFQKIIYIDADMLVVRNIDHLFSYPSISATTGGKAAHPEWTEFNSGLMVVQPDEQSFHQLLSCMEPAIKRRKELDLAYGDQDVFNQFFPDWYAFPEHCFDETYNAVVIYLDALMQSKSYKSLNQLYVLHYVGANKIWNNSLIRNLRIIRGCIHDRKPFEAKANLLYLRYLYF